MSGLARKGVTRHILNGRVTSANRQTKTKPNQQL